MDHKNSSDKKGAFALFLSGGKRREGERGPDEYSHDKPREEMRSDTDMIAKDLIDAVKAGDAMGVAHALKAFMHESKDKAYGSEEYMGDKDSYRDKSPCGCS